MQIDFKPKNQEEVFSILLFYWAYWWRAFLGCILVCIPVAILCFAIFMSTKSVLIWVIAVLLIFPAFLLSGVAITLYLFKKLASKQFKTFSVNWLMPEPESIFERNYLKKVLVYLGVSLLGGFIFGSLHALVFIVQAFIFYLFVKNQWLPFVIETKTDAA
jgi:hypothetical protein